MRRHVAWMTLIITGLVTGLAMQAVQADSLNTLMSGYVSDALASNLALQGQDAQVLEAQANLDEARARYLPQVGLSARYTLAHGGRNITFPVGDLLNPVYTTLNDMLAAQGSSTRFSMLANQEFPLLRPREQDTHLELRQPLYSPAVAAAAKTQHALLRSSEEQRNALRQTLRRDMRVAYLSWLQARDAKEIVDASQTVLQENQRINDSLFANGKVTQDQPLRARTELLAVEQQQQQAAQQVMQAQRWVNFLRNQPLDTALQIPDAEGTSDDAIWPAVDRNQLLAQASERAELRQLDAALKASSAQVDLARADALPSLALGVDAGIQGDKYGFGPDYNYVSGSLLLTWKFYAGGGLKARESAARASERRMQLKRQDIANQIKVGVLQAQDRYDTALKSLTTAQARLDAAQAAYRIAERKRDEGVITQVEYLDARNALTAAELNLNVSRFAVHIEWAELQLAAGME